MQHIVGGSFLENEIKKKKVETAELEKTLEVHSYNAILKNLFINFSKNLYYHFFTEKIVENNLV